MPPSFHFITSPQGTTMSPHVNTVTLIGKILQHWTYSDNIIVRLQMIRPSFYPKRTDKNMTELVSVVLPDAILKGQSVQIGQEVHVQGLIHSEERETSISSLVKDPNLEKKLAAIKVRQIITEVIAINWQLVK